MQTMNQCGGGVYEDFAGGEEKWWGVAPDQYELG
jgi:hypothetical protein